VPPQRAADPLVQAFIDWVCELPTA